MANSNACLHDDHEWEMECDLASIASQAAIELDNLMLGRMTDLFAAERLADILANSINVDMAGSPESQLNPTTAVAVNLAIADANKQNQFTQLADLLNEVGKLTDVLSQPNTIKNAESNELKKLRNFCLALSKRAFALEQAMQDVKPEHPFRR
jgi:hypothetical protein